MKKWSFTQKKEFSLKIRRVAKLSRFQYPEDFLTMFLEVFGLSRLQESRVKICMGLGLAGRRYFQVKFFLQKNVLSCEVAGVLSRLNDHNYLKAVIEIFRNVTKNPRPGEICSRR